MKMSYNYKTGFLVLLLQHALACAFGAQEIPISPFDKNEYGDWKATGAAFQKGPASGELLTSLEIENAGNSAVASSVPIMPVSPMVMNTENWR